MLNLRVLRIVGFSCLTILAACASEFRADASMVSDAVEEQAVGCKMKVDGGRLDIQAVGASGTIDYRWAPPLVGAQGWFGKLAADYQGAPAIGWNDDSAIVWAGSARLRSAVWAVNGKSATMLERYDTDHGDIDLNLHVDCAGSGLLLSVKASQSAIAELNFPTPDHAGGLSRLPVPYDPFDVFYAAKARLFETQYFDWSASHAASQNYPKLTYPKLTDGSRLTPDERLVIAISPKLVDVFPPQLNPPSSYIQDLAGRTIYDIWDNKGFDEVTIGLASVRDANSSPCAVIIHMWQHYGFDNGLPKVLPANLAQGGDAALLRAAAQIKGMGCRLALHQDYVDVYPNYPNFDVNDTIRTGEGRPVPGWLNTRVNIRAFAARPDRFVALASTAAPQIHARFGTDASFIDQNSGLKPWWRVDLAAGREGAGTFAPFVSNSHALWDYQRKVNGGPVFGEGQWNFYWAGDIDGVEAQPSSTTPNFSGNSLDMPLLVDFDLTRIHGWSVDHGMGYYDRWTKGYLTNTGAAHQQMQDNYRMQEIAFGHAPFICGTDWRDPIAVWSETNLIAPVAKRYGTAHPVSIRYLVDGTWQPVEQAVARNSLHTVRVDYDNGLRVIANGSDAPVQAGGFMLRKGGWTAQGSDIRAVSGWLGDTRVEFVDTPDHLFANDRALGGAPIDFGPLLTDGSVALFRDGSRWTLKMLRGSRTTIVALLTQRFPIPSTISGCGITVHTQSQGGHWMIAPKGCDSFSWAN
jgi:hypothetical protein